MGSKTSSYEVNSCDEKNGVPWLSPLLHSAIPIEQPHALPERRGPAKCFKVLGALLIVLSLLTVGWNVGLCFTHRAMFSHFVAPGVWGGILLLVTGILAVITGAKKNQHMAVATLVLAIIAIMANFAILGFGAVELAASRADNMDDGSDQPFGGFWDSSDMSEDYVDDVMQPDSPQFPYPQPDPQWNGPLFGPAPNPGFFPPGGMGDAGMPPQPFGGPNDMLLQKPFGGANDMPPQQPFGGPNGASPDQKPFKVKRQTGNAAPAVDLLPPPAEEEPIDTILMPPKPWADLGSLLGGEQLPQKLFPSDGSIEFPTDMWVIAEDAGFGMDQRPRPPKPPCPHPRPHPRPRPHHHHHHHPHDGAFKAHLAFSILTVATSVLCFAMLLAISICSCRKLCVSKHPGVIVYAMPAHMLASNVAAIAEPASIKLEPVETAAAADALEQAPPSYACCEKAALE